MLLELYSDLDEKEKIVQLSIEFLNENCGLGHTESEKYLNEVENLLISIGKPEVILGFYESKIKERPDLPM